MLAHMYSSLLPNEYQSGGDYDMECRWNGFWHMIFFFSILNVYSTYLLPSFGEGEFFSSKVVVKIQIFSVIYEIIKRFLLNNSKQKAKNNNQNIESFFYFLFVCRPYGKCIKYGDRSYYNCGRCGDFYCSEECQASDWLIHKRNCFPMP